MEKCLADTKRFVNLILSALVGFIDVSLDVLAIRTQSARGQSPRPVASNQYRGPPERLRARQQPF